MECKKDENKIGCTCTHTSCKNRGVCCECVRSHREKGEIPGCFFTAAGEATNDRSIENFVKVMSKKI
ncbi:MAG: DUF6485 family protein [Candidatus Gastranaerophilaceae bacterium]